jgi:hypothetical protein
MKIRLALANFLFQFPVCLVLVHGLFLRANAENHLESTIIISMGVFAALQFGGIWLVSWIRRDYLMSPNLWNAMRIVGGLLYLIDHPVPIILGVALFGISQALFYRYTRQLASELWTDSKEQEQAFSIMTFSVNLAFFVLPPVGSLMSHHFNVSALILTSIVFSTAGSALLFERRATLTDVKSTVTENGNTDKNARNVKSKEILLDLFLLSSFVVPYGMMMALIPLRTKSMGLGIETNGMLVSLNALLVLAILSFKILSGKALLGNSKFSERLFGISCVAWLLVLAAATLPIHLMVLCYIIWSILEAVQMPALERHIFSNRNYSAKWIDRLFLVDAVGGFVAPPIAALLITLMGLL